MLTSRNPVMFDQQDLVKIANQTMPFGKYQGTALINLPEEYLLWFVDRGFPAGKLGELMQVTLEIKINGLENLIYPLQQATDKRPSKNLRIIFENSFEDTFEEKGHEE